MMLARSWRWIAWPRRTLWPTRDGWWCLGAAIGLGFAAMNTGNNLLYLLVSMLLGLIIVSGMLSEQSIRGLRFVPVVPGEAWAGRPALVGVRIVNGKRWRVSYSITIDVLGAMDARRSAYVARLAPGEEQLVTWETTFLLRGAHPFPRLRVSTRFPFGLFVKAGHVHVGADVLVYPRIIPIGQALSRELASGAASARRRGRGSELHNLREYRAGDDPRMIHWRSSAKTGMLVIRELEAETAVDTRIVLDGTGANRERLEHGISEAASLAAHLFRAGARVELCGPGVHVPLGQGRENRRRMLTALALYDPATADRTPGPAATIRAGVREIRIAIG